MKSCSHLEEDDEHLTAERALFARRAEYLGAELAPPPLASILAHARAHERAHAKRGVVLRIARAAGRSSHSAAAVAAALFVVAGIARLGSGAAPGQASPRAIARDVPTTTAGGVLASFASLRSESAEPLACSLSNPARECLATAAAAPSEGSSALLACVGSPSSSTCEPDVTSSTSRQ